MRLTVLYFVAALSAACATNPVSGKKELSLLSEAEELAMGQQADAEIRREMGVYPDQELQRYVSERGKIVPSRITAVSALKQRELARAIKRARFIGIMSYAMS